MSLVLSCTGAARRHEARGNEPHGVRGQWHDQHGEASYSYPSAIFLTPSLDPNLPSTWHLLGKFLACFLHLLEVFLRSSWHYPDIFLTSFWNLPGIFLIYPGNTLAAFLTKYQGGCGWLGLLGVSRVLRHHVQQTYRCWYGKTSHIWRLRADPSQGPMQLQQ